MTNKYFIDDFESAYVDIWTEDIEELYAEGIELASLKISGDSELHFLSHIEYETSQGKSEESFLGSPEISDIEIMESVDDEIDEIIEKLSQSFLDNNQNVEEDYIPEEFNDIYRCCVDYIILKALERLVEKLPQLKIRTIDNFTCGLYRHDDSSITIHNDNDIIIEKYLREYSFSKEEIQLISELLFQDLENREWLMRRFVVENVE